MGTRFKTRRQLSHNLIEIGGGKMIDVYELDNACDGNCDYCPWMTEGGCTA